MRSTIGDSKLMTVAHRGAAGYCPENTMASFRRAIDMKADLLELDVHLSKDGELIVIHDHSIDRTTNGMGKVSDYTLEELRRWDAGSWFDIQFEGEKIPSLREVLELSKGKAGLLIEIKNPLLNPEIELKLADELKANGVELTEVIVQSFDSEVIERFHKILPEVALGILVSKEESCTRDRIMEYAAYCTYMNASIGLVSLEMVDMIHSQHMKIFPWTVRAMEQVRPLIEMGVDGIITDYPDYTL